MVARGVSERTTLFHNVIYVWRASRFDKAAKLGDLDTNRRQKQPPFYSTQAHFIIALNLTISRVPSRSCLVQEY